MLRHVLHMNIGIYQGAASLAACERWQAVISQNIASSTVPGFKKVEATFESVLADKTRLGSESGAGKDINGVMPAMVNRLSTQQGELRTTNNEFDFAIQGPGFFQIQRPNGQPGFTRNGEFHVNSERVLVTREGYPVLGDGGPITLKSGGGRLSVNSEGSLVQGDTQIGKIGLFSFRDPSALKHIGDGLLAPGNDSAQPQPVENGSLLGGALEGSNVSPLREMVNLISVGRAYEASQKVIIAHDQAVDKAIQTLGNPNA